MPRLVLLALALTFLTLTGLAAPGAAQTPLQSSGGAVQAGVNATLVLDTVVFEGNIMLSTWFSDWAVRTALWLPHRQTDAGC